MDEVFLKANQAKSHTYKEYEYLEYDRKAIKQSSNIFTTKDPELEELENSDSDQDVDKKPLESDEDELVRRLKLIKLAIASDHLVKATKEKKDLEAEKEKKAKVTIKADFDPLNPMKAAKA